MAAALVVAGAAPLACAGALRAQGLPAGAEVTRDPATGAIRWLRGGDLSRELESDARFRADQAQGRAEAVARRFLEAYAGAFGLDDPARELRLDRIDRDASGRTRVRFAQTWRGIPVLRGVVHVHLDPAHRVALVNGDYLPTPSGLDPKPALSADQARTRAAGDGGCAGCDAELVVTTDRDGRPRLAWRVRSGSGGFRAQETLVDARSGDVLASQPLAYPSESPRDPAAAPVAPGTEEVVR
jgi:Zn-dependent metalloprotease